MQNRLKSWLKIRLKPIDSKQGATRGDEGFTLIEMAIALAILGILVAIAVPSYLNVRNRAYDSESKQTLGEIRSMAWSQYLEQDAWPAEIEDLGYDDGAAADGIHTTERWTYTVEAGAVAGTLDICAQGVAGEPSEGRSWLLNLDQQGTGTLDGPNGCP